MTARKTHIEPMARVEVRWIDAWSLNQITWEPPIGYATDHTDYVTIGYFVEQNERYIMVAQSRGVDESTNLGNIFRIPVGSIVSIEELTS